MAELTEDGDILSLVVGENDVSTIIDISGKDDFLSQRPLYLIEKEIEAEEVAPVITEIPLEIRKPAIPPFRPFGDYHCTGLFSSAVFLHAEYTLQGSLLQMPLMNSGLR
jgi:hypothetical protein